MIVEHGIVANISAGMSEIDERLRSLEKLSGKARKQDWMMALFVM